MLRIRFFWTASRSFFFKCLSEFGTEDGHIKDSSLEIPICRISTKGRRTHHILHKALKKKLSKSQCNFMWIQPEALLLLGCKSQSYQQTSMGQWGQDRSCGGRRAPVQPCKWYWSSSAVCGFCWSFVDWILQLRISHPKFLRWDFII